MKPGDELVSQDGRAYILLLRVRVVPCVIPGFTVKGFDVKSSLGPEFWLSEETLKIGPYRLI